MPKITNVYAREILNSKAVPTVEATVVLDDSSWATASCPTGTSLSHFEAKEVRDNDPDRLNGQGVLTAVSNVVNVIGPKLKGIDAINQTQVDRLLMELDGTPDKSRLGSNALLPVSMAVCKAAAHSLKKPLFQYVRGCLKSSGTPLSVPTPCFNVLNGGMHGGNNLDFQEFIVSPATSMPFDKAINMAVIVYTSLKKTLEMNNASTLVGDEGGFAPTFPTNKEAIGILKEAIELTKYKFGFDIFLGLDAAANSFFDGKKYRLRDKAAPMSSEELIGFYKSVNEEFPLLYLEDPLADDEIDSWSQIGPDLSSSTIIVGDDLTATNPLRLQNAISKKAVSAVIIKPNQIGTVSESLAVVEMARAAGLKLVVSHRSGETNDDFIADYSVGISADFVKFGAPARGERVAKYNRLLAIEQQLKFLKI